MRNGLALRGLLLLAVSLVGCNGNAAPVDEADGDAGIMLLPPAEEAPAEDPPTEDPSAEDPAAEDPRVEDDPPVEEPPVEEPAAIPGDGVEFVPWESQQMLGDPRWGAPLTDIANHIPSSYGDTYWFDDSAITAGHETTHGINAHLRNEVYDHSAGWVKVNGFYVLEDRAVFVLEPGGVRKSDADRYIPVSLRGSRYDLYIVHQTAWDDTPTYVFDEWVAYTNGGAVGVDQVDRGLHTEGWTDGVYGQLEFTIYALALAMAVEALNPEYFATYPQFREFVAWNARRALAIYRKGSAMDEFAYDVQDAYYEAIRTAPDAEDLRAFTRRVYGDAFMAEVFEL